MLSLLLAGALISVINFGIHGAATALIVVVTRRIAALTDALHVFARMTVLLTITGILVTIAHGIEIALWAGYYTAAGIATDRAGPFEFAFENYTALGYGDTVPAEGKRVIGPITALNGLLLIGWSVAIIFEVLRMAEIQIGRHHEPTR
jgi:hypothetical protein